MSFNPSLFSGLQGVVTTVTTVKNSGGDSKKNEKPSNGAACKAVSPLSPLSPPKNDKPAKNQTTNTDKEAGKVEALAQARSDFLTHKDTCPTCRLSWAATASCETFGELWLAYHKAMVDVHGVDLVDGPRGRSGQPETDSQKESTNGYKTVVTSQVRPLAWRRAEEGYYSHLMTCDACKPSWLCPEGRQLRQEYNTISAVPTLAK